MEPQSFSCAGLAREKRLFISAIEKEFESVIQSAKEHNKFEWAYLKKFYNCHKTDLTKLYSLRIFCEFAFKLFFKFNCEDDEFVIKIIRIYQQVLIQYTRLDLCSNCKELNNIPKHYEDEDLINSRSILRMINKLSDDTYKFTNHDFYSRFAIGAIYAGDHGFLQFLVKYGLSYNPEDILKQTRNKLGILFSNYVSWIPHVGIIDVTSERERFADSILDRLLTNMKNPNLSKINLIVLAVDISLCKYLGDIYYPDYVRCWNIYASTLSETAISMKDVKDFLDLVFTSDIGFIADTYATFQEIFPETPSLSSPRSLKYLCRCKVRDCIKKWPSLPIVISKMQIPVTVKQFLLHMAD